VPCHIDSVGDRRMSRLAYQNFGTYESFLGSQTVRVGTTCQLAIYGLMAILKATGGGDQTGAAGMILPKPVSVRTIEATSSWAGSTLLRGCGKTTPRLKMLSRFRDGCD